MSSVLERGGESATFVLKLNPAPSWRQIKVFCALVGGTSLFVAVMFVAVGVWPILPFAGLEILLLGWALYHTARNAQFQEVVRVNREVIEIARGRSSAE
jgi:uncharacterized membrane protein